MPKTYFPFTGRIDRRGRRNEGDYSRPYMRENFLSRDGILEMPGGTERALIDADTNIKALLHMEGAHNSTVFTDEVGHVFTRSGSAIISQDQYINGTSSLFLDGASYLTSADSADWYFGTGDFTIKFWVFFNSTANVQYFVCQTQDGNNKWELYKNTGANQALGLYFTIGGVAKAYYEMSGASGIVAGQWYHIAFQRNTTSAKIFINGVSKTLTETTAFGANDVGDVTGPLYVGSANSGAGYISGYMKDVVITKGIAEYSTNFTPPSAMQSYTAGLTDRIRWAARYNTLEVGSVSPKTLLYTKDGCIWSVNDLGRTATLESSSLNIDAFPRHWTYKSGTQTYMYIVDGKDLWKYDGNNDNNIEKITITDTSGASINPIDVMEHKDRLCLMSKAYLYVSKNLSPEVFNDSTDSIQIVVGSGKGENLSLGKIPGNDTLYIFNTEGIFALYGDTISAVASTFEIRPVDNKKIIAGRTAKFVENAIVFLADDYNLWSFNGSICTKLSHDEKIEDFFNRNRDYLDKAVATYYNNYYMLSFVETGETDNKLEIWWDSLENKCEFVRGRNVSCYLEIDPTIETPYQQIGRSDINMLCWVDRSKNFDNTPINVRLWTKDITIEKGRNVRFTAFYPEIEPQGDRNVIIRYWLDGRLGDSSNNAQFTQNLRGETTGPGIIKISNQTQFTGRVRPKINYAKGQSIAFYIYFATLDQKLSFKGMGIEYVAKANKHVKTVGG